MNKYPFVKQKDLKDCGVCSLLMIIKYYKSYIPLEKLREMTYTSKEGVSAYNIIEASKKIGFNSEGLKVNNLENIKLPCIAHVIVDNSFKHYIVIYEVNYKKDYILIADPASRIKKISIQEFNKIFSNIIITFKPIKKLLYISDNTYLKKYLKELIKEKKTKFIKIIIISFLSILLSVITSFYIEIMIKKINSGLLFKTFLLFLSLFFIKTIFEYIREKILINLYNEIELSFTNEILKNIISLPYKYFKNRTTGEVLSRINDLSIVNEEVVKIIITIFIDLFLSLFVSIFLFKINKILFLISFIIMILYLLIVLKYKNKIKQNLEQVKEEKTSLNSYIVESIDSYETIKGLSIEKNITDNLIEKNKKYINKNKSYEKICNKEYLYKNILNEIGICILIFIGILLIKNDYITLTSLITFTSLFSYYITPIKDIIDLNKDIKDAKISFDRINEIMIENREENKLLNIPFNNLEIKNLKYSYDNYNNIIENLNLKINKNEKIMLIGSSGCGKSTFLKILKKYYQINHGQVLINNIDINNLSKEEIDKNITYVSQQEKLFTDTIYNNLLLGRKINKKIIINIIKNLKIDFLDKELFLDTFIEENGLNLSGGERQRIVLARSLLNDFNILLLDESLSEVDIKLEREILKNIFKMYKDKIIIVVSHRMDNKDLFDKIINLKTSL